VRRGLEEAGALRKAKLPKLVRLVRLETYERLRAHGRERRRLK